MMTRNLKPIATLLSSKAPNLFLTQLPTTTLHTKPTRQENREEEEEEEEWSVSGGGRFQLHKSRGQHILTNPRVLDSIVRRAEVLPTDTVLEIGPGTGNLTVRLLQSARSVVAVEIDARMVDVLSRRVEKLGLQDRLTVITGNALRTQFPPFDLCVSNIPYGISSSLIAKLLFPPSRPSFRNATLLLQKEFAQRLVAKPGSSDFNRLAVNVGLVATVDFLMNVSKRDFVPCPKVDSSLVRIRQRSEVPAVDLDEWLAFTRTCFSKRNKTLGAIFKQKRKIADLLGRSQNSVTICEVLKDGNDEDEDEDEDEDDLVDRGMEKGNREVKGGDRFEVSRFKEKIIGILRARGFEEKRPSKMSNEDLLDLLRLFNEEGILFNN